MFIETMPSGVEYLLGRPWAYFQWAQYFAQFTNMPNLHKYNFDIKKKKPWKLLHPHARAHCKRSKHEGKLGWWLHKPDARGPLTMATFLLSLKCHFFLFFYCGHQTCWRISMGLENESLTCDGHGTSLQDNSHTLTWRQQIGAQIKAL